VLAKRRWGALAAAVAALGALGAASPSAEQAERGRIPIDHVVVMMQENRSFDSYFGQIHFQGQPRTAPEPRTASNPNPTGKDSAPIRVFHKTAVCESADLNHSWTGTHNEIDGGRMDGFTAANVDPSDPNGSRTMGYFDSRELPFYYALFSEFGMADRYFASVPGPTFPNREYLLAGTSFGHIQNDLPPTGLTGRSIFNELDESHTSWRIYFNDLPAGFLFGYVRLHAAGHVVPVSQYYVDAAAGRLPQVSFVDPRFGGTNNLQSDEHAPANIQVGEQFTAGVISALFKSPDWSSSALFLTWDEGGGYFDHVPPPRAPAPDGFAPMLGPGDTQAAFDRYGVRVPAVVVSPFARAHFVSHDVYDHTSILRFIETRFGLPPLTRRDASSNPMLDFFNFHHPPFEQPPVLPQAPLDPAVLAQCAAAPAQVGDGL
jgi:phospholipase C